jgi:hypothetical protein
MSKSRIFLTLLFAVALALTFGARSASADTIDYTLNSPNAALSSYPGPYGTVDVNLTGGPNTNVAVITFTANPDPVTGGSPATSNVYLFSDSSMADVNTNGAVTVSSVSDALHSPNSSGISFVNFNSPSASFGGSGNVDGFGTFNVTIDNNSGFDQAVNFVQFTVTKNSGTWSSASNVLASNGAPNNAFIAAHVYVAQVSDSTVDEHNGALATGFVANGGATSVPEPSTMAIAALGALGFIGYGLRRRLKK